MPVRFVKIKGKEGYMYGYTGKFYPVKEYGQDTAYEKAMKQERAIKASQSRKIEVKSSKRSRGYVRQI